MKINLNQAVEILKNGGICGIPTETVYGLAAKFDEKSAIEKVFSLKGRPLDHPLILHIAKLSALSAFAINIPDYVALLAEHFWPGPLTLVLKKNNRVSDLITAGQSTVAIRMPNHDLTRALIEKLDCPIVAPSANRFSQTSPTLPDHIESGLGRDVPILDGGPCFVGIESTIILATETNSTSLLRPGIISTTEIEMISGVPCFTSNNTSVRTPGNHMIHYQPQRPMLIINDINAARKTLSSSLGKRYCAMLLSTKEIPGQHKVIEMPKNPAEYGRLLYQYWQSPEILSADTLLIELPPDEENWRAIRDRIFKASSGFFVMKA